jgi:hypothetical protein
MINIGSDIASSMSKNSEADDPLCFHRRSQLKKHRQIHIFPLLPLFLSFERFLHNLKEFYG